MAGFLHGYIQILWHKILLFRLRLVEKAILPSISMITDEMKDRTGGC